jgi:hypothetical protein
MNSFEAQMTPLPTSNPFQTPLPTSVADTAEDYHSQEAQQKEQEDNQYEDQWLIIDESTWFFSSYFFYSNILHTLFSDTSMLNIFILKQCFLFLFLFLFIVACCCLCRFCFFFFFPVPRCSLCTRTTFCHVTHNSLREV